MRHVSLLWPLSFVPFCVSKRRCPKGSDLICPGHVSPTAATASSRFLSIFQTVVGLGCPFPLLIVHRDYEYVSLKKDDDAIQLKGAREGEEVEI